MATYSNNTTIKFNSNVSVTINPYSGATTTIYTVPLNSYLVLRDIRTTSVSSFGTTFFIDGIRYDISASGTGPYTCAISSANSTFTTSSSPGTPVAPNPTIHAPYMIIAAGSAIAVQALGISSGTLEFRGTLFSNTP